MSWLKAAFARVRQILSQETATPIQPAGPVPPEPTAQLGSKPTAQTTSLHPPPVKPEAKRAKKPAAKTKAAAKRTPAKALAQTRTTSRSGGRGN